MSANGIAHLATRELRQKAKLDLAQTKRRGSTPSGALAFSGSSQLSLSDAANLKLGNSTAFTIEFFIYMTAYQTAYAPTILQKGGQKNVNYSTYTVLMFNGKMYFGTGTGAGGANTGGKEVTSSTDLPLSQWNHIAIVWNGTNLVMYQNGVSVGTAAASPLQMGDNSSGVTIGNITGGTDYFIGSLSNIRIVKNVAVYTGAFTVPIIPLTSTQSSGTNITAITGTATSLLLNAASSATYLTDSSSYAATVSNSNVTWGNSGPAIANTSAVYYRARNTYDITQLPTQYDDNGIIDNPNTGGLVVGRPWITAPENSLVTNGLVLHYDFSNPACYTSGTTVTDLSTSTNNGTVVNESGNVSYVSDGQTSYFNWSSNQGANGLGSCISVSDQETYKDFTMVFMPNFGEGFGGLFAMTADQSLRVYNGLTWGFPNPGNGNDWAHPSATTFYINGQATTSDLTPAVAGWNIMGGAKTSPNFPEPSNLYIGTSGYDNRHMQGRIAVVLMYNRALTQEEQLQNYNSLKTRFGL
jgi:hypothetical protein